MAKRDYTWLTKRYDRMVEHLHLWDENPRLDPSERYIYLRDFIEGMITTPTDRKDFIDLAQSIVDKGFIPADPIVIWKNTEKDKFYVAEGNRRIAVLKLLLEPLKAPRSIKKTMTAFSKQIDHGSIIKIPVAIADTFEDAIWYINQRHTPDSDQKKWGRENHLRWISGLYDRFARDIDLIKEYTDISEGELNKSICILKMKDLIDEIKDKLTIEEYTEAKSKSFPISTLERFVTKSFVQEKMGFEFVDSGLKFTKLKNSFLEAYTAFIKRMLLPKGDLKKIDSRQLNTNEDIIKVLDELPLVIEGQEPEGNPSDTPPIENKPKENDTPPNIPILPTIPLKNNPSRKNIILNIYQLDTDDYRLLAVFNELKKLSLSSYPNIASAAIRIFLDIAVRNFIISESYDAPLSRVHSCNFERIGLQERLKYIKEVSNKLNKESKAIITNLLNHDYHYSLHILNGYVHGSKTHTINREYMNSFWDSLFPFFEKILDIKEIE